MILNLINLLIFIIEIVNLIMLFKYIRRQIPSIFSTIQVVNGSVDVNGEYTYTARTPTSSPVYSKDGNLWIFRNKTIAGGLGLREWVIVEASEWLPVWTVYSRQTQSTPPPENVKYAYHSIEGVDTTRIPPSSKWKNRVNEDTDIIINQPFNLEIFRYPDLKYNNREQSSSISLKFLGFTFSIKNPSSFSILLKQL